VSEVFRPPGWSAGGNRQTLYGYWRRYGLRWPYPAEPLVVEAEPGVRLLVKATWQPDRERHPTLVVVHGLGGSSEGSYGLSLGRIASDAGWNVARMNLRGAGDGAALCPLLYNAGLDGDLVAVLQAIARLTPRLALAGFSLGGNLAVLALGRRATQLPEGLFGAAVVSTPLDLSACADALDSPRNRHYCWNYMVVLRRGYRERQRARPDLFEAGRERGLRTIRGYDDRITAFYGGYTGAADYYARSSSGPHLVAVERPLLLLAAQDDPMIPIQSSTRYAVPARGNVVWDVQPTGGHVGFVGCSSAPGGFWAAERVMRFLVPLAG
jgi:predicted alpha/beta-fold hydrolase